VWSLRLRVNPQQKRYLKSRIHHFQKYCPAEARRKWAQRITTSKHAQNPTESKRGESILHLRVRKSKEGDSNAVTKNQLERQRHGRLRNVDSGVTPQTRTGLLPSCLDHQSSQRILKYIQIQWFQRTKLPRRKSNKKRKKNPGGTSEKTFDPSAGVNQHHSFTGGYFRGIISQRVPGKKLGCGDSLI